MSSLDVQLPDLGFAARRQTVLERLGNGIAVFRAPELAVHANDVEYRYRPESNFYYLTGFPEPGAVAVLDAASDRERFVLFVPPRDPERETWTGRRAGVEGAIMEYGADAAYPLQELEDRLVPLIARAEQLFYHLGNDEALDLQMLELARRAWASRPRAASGLPHSIIDPGPIVHEMRLFKSEAELAWMRRAIAIAAEAHREAMRETRPEMGENEIEALVEYTFRRRGASGWAYPSIIAGGENATVLHYTANRDRLRDGDLLLIDAGAELGCYCADITRTFPVGRDFRPPQRRAYEIVLESQLEAIRLIRPGVTIDEVHDRAVAVLVDGLRSLGLLSEPRDKILADALYRPYYMHRTSHWLGMDVHDVGAYRSGTGSRRLEPGMILTVEPGLYFSPQLAEVPDQYRGIGIRIEDDVLVTPQGHEVLSAAVPKSVEDVLALRAG